MADLKVGDTIFFSSVATLVNEGTVEAIQGPYVKVKTKCPNVNYIRKDEAFLTKSELRESKAYNEAWSSQRARQRYQRSFTAMTDMRLF